MREKVKQRREELRMTQEELAEKAGISRQTVHLIESGKADNVTIATISAIAKVLDRPLEYFFDQAG